MIIWGKMISNPNVNLIITGGASGVGKTTYLRELSVQTGVRVINFGEIIARTAHDISGKSYQELITAQKFFIKEQAGLHFIRDMMQERGAMVVDGHYVDVAVDVIQQGMPDFFWREFDKYILFSADSSEIRRRRINDTRPRSPNLAEIEIVTESEERVMHNLALHFGKPFEVIDLGKSRSELKYDLRADCGATFPLVRSSKER